MFHTTTHDARAFAVLTPEQSAAIFQKDLANIIAKTRDGKTLRATERRALRSVPVIVRGAIVVGRGRAAVARVSIRAPRGHFHCQSPTFYLSEG